MLLELTKWLLSTDRETNKLHFEKRFAFICLQIVHTSKAAKVSSPLLRSFSEEPLETRLDTSRGLHNVEFEIP